MTDEPFYTCPICGERHPDADPPDPTPEEIAERAAECRALWTSDDWQSRGRSAPRTYSISRQALREARQDAEHV